MGEVERPPASLAAAGRCLLVLFFLVGESLGRVGVALVYEMTAKLVSLVSADPLSWLSGFDAGVGVGVVGTELSCLAVTDLDTGLGFKPN